MMLWIGVAAHAVSWFSPVVDVGTGAAPWIGLQAYLFTAFASIHELGSLLSGSGGFDERGALRVSLSPHTSYLVPAAVWLVAYKREPRPGLAALLMAGAVVIDTVYWAGPSSGILWGYYLWLASFALIGSAAVWGVLRLGGRYPWETRLERPADR